MIIAPALRGCVDSHLHGNHTFTELGTQSCPGWQASLANRYPIRVRTNITTNNRHKLKTIKTLALDIVLIILIALVFQLFISNTCAYQ